MLPGGHLYPISDPSLSKTHLSFGPLPHGVWVLDHHSTNGTVVSANGMSMPCTPGVRVDALFGGVIAGDVSLQVVPHERSQVSQPPALAGYSPIELIGTGGYADVFLYEQQMPNRQVAVKVLIVADALSGDAQRRQFTAEANLMAKVSSHPFIVSIIHADVAPDGPGPYIIMEYYPGDNYLRAGRGASSSVWPRCCEWVCRLAAHWRPPTVLASRIATSSLPTSSPVSTAGRAWPTSASLLHRARKQMRQRASRFPGRHQRPWCSRPGRDGRRVLACRHPVPPVGRPVPLRGARRRQQRPRPHVAHRTCVAATNRPTRCTAVTAALVGAGVGTGSSS